jgi:hypothetical protein
MAPYMKTRNRNSKYTISKTIRVDESINRLIAQYAEENDISQSEAIRELLSHGLNFYHYYKNNND